MGYNTSFMLLNDEVSRLRDDPEVGRILHEMVQDVSAPKQHRRHQYGYKGVRVIHCAHASQDQIIRVGGNRGEIIGFGYTIDGILKAAVALAKTKDPSERRRLIREIEKRGEILDRFPVPSDSGFSL